MALARSTTDPKWRLSLRPQLQNTPVLQASRYRIALYIQQRVPQESIIQHGFGLSGLFKRVLLQREPKACLMFFVCVSCFYISLIALLIAPFLHKLQEPIQL